MILGLAAFLACLRWCSALCALSLKEQGSVELLEHRTASLETLHRIDARMYKTLRPRVSSSLPLYFAAQGLGTASSTTLPFCRDLQVTLIMTVRKIDNVRTQPAATYTIWKLVRVERGVGIESDVAAWPGA